jgi:hypothetical protein
MHYNVCQRHVFVQWGNSCASITVVCNSFVMQYGNASALPRVVMARASVTFGARQRAQLRELQNFSRMVQVFHLS